MQEIELFDLGFIENMFDYMKLTKDVAQDATYHPEGDVWTHSFQALGRALKESHDTDLIFAAWLHDIGKHVESHRHEKHSVKLLKHLVSPKTLWLIEHHMRIRYWQEGIMQKHSKVIELRDSLYLPQLVHLRRIDMCARKANYQFNITPEELTNELNKRVRQHFEFNRRKKQIARGIANAH